MLTHRPLKILTFDLGTKCGWASLDENEVINSGVLNCKPDGIPINSGVRFLNFENFLNHTFESPIDKVYFEIVRRHMGVYAAHIYGGFWAMLTKWCDAREIPYEGVAVGTIKKHVTGKGNAKKPQVIEAIEARGHQPEDDNEADALAILYYAMETQ